MLPSFLENFGRVIHRLNRAAFVIGLIFFGVPGEAYPGTQAQVLARQWVQSHWLDPAARPPFSFALAGVPSERLLSTWQRRVDVIEALPEKQTYIISYMRPNGSLIITCNLVEHLRFPIIEWSLEIVNKSHNESQLLSDLKALDVHFKTTATTSGDAVSVTRMRGDDYSANSFRPITEDLLVGTHQSFTPVGGRSTNGEAPYFSITWDSGGVLLGGGWPGQWKARFDRLTSDQFRAQFGQELTSFKLLTQEKVILPRIAIQFTKGEIAYAHNTWRKWMLEEVLPKPGGAPLKAAWAANAGKLMDTRGNSVQSQIDHLKLYEAGNMSLDYWWMDAGWYPLPKCGVWASTGTWEVDSKRFPDGLAPVSSAASSRGKGSILWFEPERVAPGTWLYENHPEWLIGSIPSEINCTGNANATLSDNSRLLNLGNPEALQWLNHRMDRLIRSQGIDIFRFDFNMNPLSAWRDADTSNRLGITENKYVQGYLEFLDGLRARNPGLLIDTCASGGRRLDLATLRRAFPLLRSDYTFKPIAQQAHTYGLAYWIPYFGSPVPESISMYEFQSVMTPMLLTVYDYDFLKQNLAPIKKLTDISRRVAGFFLADYYPLSHYSIDPKEWMAWQFHDKQSEAGLVQAFRRSSSAPGEKRFLLKAIRPEHSYMLEDLNNATSITMTGTELLSRGVLIDLADAAPQSALFRYQKADSQNGRQGSKTKLRRNASVD